MAHSHRKEEGRARRGTLLPDWVYPSLEPPHLRKAASALHPTAREKFCKALDKLRLPADTVIDVTGRMPPWVTQIVFEDGQSRWVMQLARSGDWVVAPRRRLTRGPKETIPDERLRALYRSALKSFQTLRKEQRGADAVRGRWTVVSAQQKLDEVLQRLSYVLRLLTVVEDGDLHLAVNARIGSPPGSSPRVLTLTWSRFMSGDFMPSELCEEMLAEWLGYTVETVRRKISG